MTRSAWWQEQARALGALRRQDLAWVAAAWLLCALLVLFVGAQIALTRQRQLFDNAAAHIQALLDAQLIASESIMLGLREVSRQHGAATDIATFATQVHSRYPFVFLLGFQPRVSLQARQAYEAEQSRLYLTPIRIRDFVPQLPTTTRGATPPWHALEHWRLAPARAFYLPLTMTEPSGAYPSRYMLGLDLLATRALGPALRQSMRSAETEVSLPLTLSNGHPGLAYVQAIYRPTPHAPGHTRPDEALLGAATLVIQADLLLAGATLPDDLNLSLDLQRLDGPERIALHRPAAAATEGWPRLHTRLGMRQSYFPYQLHVSSVPRWDQLVPPPLPYLPLLLAAPALWALLALGHYRLRMRQQSQQFASLHAKRQLAATALNATADAIIVLDTALRVTHLNASASLLCGLNLAEARERPLADVLPLHYELATDQHEDLAQRCRDNVSAVALPLHCYLGTPTSEIRYVEGDFTPALDANGKVQGIVLTLRASASGDARLARTLAHRDERLKQHAAEYDHAARKASLGEMASGIAHEINQPLSAITSYNEAALTLLDDEDADRDLLRKALQGSIEQAERAGHIIRGLRRLASSKRPELVPVDVNQAIRNAVVLVSPELRHRTLHLSTRLQPKLPLVFADMIQLEQVLLNLIRNAIEACPEGPAWGQITLQSTTTDHGVAIHVRDSGPGIPAAQLPHIFSPFYSQKPQGMGLGLTICQTLIESFGGRIDARNLTDGGAQFTVELPALATTHRAHAHATDDAHHLYH